MHHVIRILSRVTERYYPSRLPSFDLVHVFKTLQLLHDRKKVSRALLTKELDLGEGSVKTLIKHMKMCGLVENSNSGTWFTEKGRAVYDKLHISIPKEMEIPNCPIAVGRFNHAVLVKGIAHGIQSGVEQRDIAIKSGALGATTLVFRNGRLIMPNTPDDLMINDPGTHFMIINDLTPEENDVVIIGSSQYRKVAEIAAKSTALHTIAYIQRSGQ